MRDRACLRLLYRADAATAEQLAVLVYENRRTAQRRLRALWLAGLAERTTLPPPTARGGAPNAYRLSARGCRLLGYREPRRRQTHLAHALACVDTVCSLLRSQCAESHVQAWLTEPMARGLLRDGVQPDGVVVLQVGNRSAVLCLEVDNATEHAAEIRRKLLGYERSLRSRNGWHLLLVVPGAGRAGWVRRLAARERHVQSRRAWVVEFQALRTSGVAALIDPLASGTARPLRSLAMDRKSRLCVTPVGSWPWLELLASGGAEDLGACLR